MAYEIDCKWLRWSHGQALIKLIDEQMKLAGGLEAAAAGQDLGVLAGEKLACGQRRCTDINEPPIVIDFTTQPPVLAALAAQARLVHIIGTTGDATKKHRRGAPCAHCQISNMSLGVIAAA